MNILNQDWADKTWLHTETEHHEQHGANDQPAPLDTASTIVLVAAAVFALIALVSGYNIQTTTQNDSRPTYYQPGDRTL